MCFGAACDAASAWMAALFCTASWGAAAAWARWGEAASAALIAATLACGADWTADCPAASDSDWADGADLMAACAPADCAALAERSCGEGADLTAACAPAAWAALTERSCAAGADLTAAWAPAD